TAITPASGVIGTSMPVILTGTNLTGANLNLGTGLTAPGVLVTAGQITANLVIAPDAPLGQQSITVTTAAATSNGATFTIVPPTPAPTPAPVLATMALSSGVIGTSEPLVLTGTNLTGATLNLGTGLTATNVVVTSTQITGTLAVDPT